eukprot:1629948-Pleurochrysis_carterae.AAC.6
MYCQAVDERRDENTGETARPSEAVINLSHQTGKQSSKPWRRSQAALEANRCASHVHTEPRGLVTTDAPPVSSLSSLPSRSDDIGWSSSLADQEIHTFLPKGFIELAELLAAALPRRCIRPSRGVRALI